MDSATRLDAIDWAILERLQSDATIQNKDLAAQVGIAPSTCLDRVRRLRDRQVIVGYHAEVSPEAVGLAVQAILAVQVRPHTREVFARFVDFALDVPEVRALFHVSGEADFLVHVACVDTRHLQQLVLDEVQTRKEVVAVHSSIVYEQVRKDALRPPDPVRTPSLITPRAQARRRKP
ncbi:Lrp/AsnC family transcriptional regulator [Longispora urticae]